MQASDDHFSQPDLAGEYYHLTLARLHRLVNPKCYLEVGTEHGETLKLAKCAAVAVDPLFQFKSSDVLTTMASRKFLHLHQTTSDEFFAHQTILEPSKVTPLFAFLDGLHHCEALLRDFTAVERLSDRTTVVAIHDVVPVEVGMTSRNQYPSAAPIASHRLGWWTGDVWKTALFLKQNRPNLHIIVLDCYPTGLMLVGNLDSRHSLSRSGYAAACKQMDAMSLDEIGVVKLHRELQLTPTGRLDDVSDIHAFLGMQAP